MAEIAVNRLLSIWAKSCGHSNLPVSLSEHMETTANVCQALIEGPYRKTARVFEKVSSNSSDILPTIVSWHDLGKCERRFQSYIHRLGPNLGKTPYLGPYHEQYTGWYVQKKLIQNGVDKETACVIADSLAMHHARKCDRVSAIQDISLFDAHYQDIEIKPFLNPCVSGLIIAGLTVVSDWIASTRGVVSGRLVDDARSALLNIGMYGDSSWTGRSFEENFGGKTPRGCQIVCMNLAPKVTLIEDQTGSGKTEAVLTVAANLIRRSQGDLTGFYYALPTKASSDQMCARLQTICGPRLVHGDRYSVEMTVNSNNVRPDWFYPLNKALIAPYSVGTVDQLMKGAMNSRFGFMRMFALSNKVVIIDELHAYDAYMMTVIRRFIEWCKPLNIPIILLSATCTSEMKRECGGHTSDYPCVTADGVELPIEISTTRSRNINVEVLQDDVVEYVPRMASTGSVGVICNRVCSAQRYYRTLKDNGLPVLLYHSRYKKRDRRRIENLVMSRYGKVGEQYSTSKTVLVATQVVEQSLDISFDSMISELAPIDLLLQRFGRAKRVGGDVTVHVVDDNHTYYIYLLKRTFSLLPRTITVPSQDVRTMVDYVYAANYEDSDYEEIAKAEQMMVQDANRLLLEAPYADHRFMDVVTYLNGAEVRSPTRWDDTSIMALFKEDANRIFSEYGSRPSEARSRAVQEEAVNARIEWIDKIENGVPVMKDEILYDSELGAYRQRDLDGC